MHEQLTSAKPRIRAQKKHVVLFIIACVILAVSIVTFSLSLALLQDMTAPAPETGETSEAGLLGGEIIGVFLSMFTSIVTMMLIMLFHAFLWGTGMLVSARLAFDKHDKPKWLWICSCILTAVFSVPVIASLGLIAYVLIVLFVL